MMMMMMMIGEFNIPIIKSNSCFPAAHCQSTLGPWDATGQYHAGRENNGDDRDDHNDHDEDDDHDDGFPANSQPWQIPTFSWK